MKLFSIFFYILLKDLRLAYRTRGEMSIPLFFFIMVVSLFPLALNAKPSLLAELAPGVIWIAALLGTLLSLNNLFYIDFLDGSLEQWLLSPAPLPLLILAKVGAHWLVSGIPLMIAAPMLAGLLYLPAKSALLLSLSLFIGTPVLHLIGAMCLSLTLGLRNGGMLLSLLILPLYIPVLIFGVGVSGVEGYLLGVQLAWLGAFLCLAVSLCPWVSAFAFKMSVL